MVLLIVGVTCKSLVNREFLDKFPITNLPYLTMIYRIVSEKCMVAVLLLVTFIHSDFRDWNLLNN